MSSSLRRRNGPLSVLAAAGLAPAAWLGLSTAPAEATACAGTVSPPAGTGL